MTCVKMVPWNGKAKDFLLIWPIKFPKGYKQRAVRDLEQPELQNDSIFTFLHLHVSHRRCWSYVGKFGGAQIVSLQPPDARGPNCLGKEGRAIHELLHALGIFHEQSRADRDRFVDVHTENVIPGKPD